MTVPVPAAAGYQAHEKMGTAQVRDCDSNTVGTSESSAKGAIIVYGDIPIATGVGACEDGGAVDDAVF